MEMQFDTSLEVASSTRSGMVPKARLSQSTYPATAYGRCSEEEGGGCFQRQVMGCFQIEIVVIDKVRAEERYK